MCTRDSRRISSRGSLCVAYRIDTHSEASQQSRRRRVTTVENTVCNVGANLKPQHRSAPRGSRAYGSGVSACEVDAPRRVTSALKSAPRPTFPLPYPVLRGLSSAKPPGRSRRVPLALRVRWAGLRAPTGHALGCSGEGTPKGTVGTSRSNFPRKSLQRLSYGEVKAAFMYVSYTSNYSSCACVSCITSPPTMRGVPAAYSGSATVKDDHWAALMYSRCRGGNIPDVL